jgi:hypothetical protein
MPRRGKVIPLPLRRVRTDESGLVAVHRCAPPEALVVTGLLESAGIPTVVRSRLTHAVHPFSVGAQGEAIILVPRGEAARSRRLLARFAPGPAGS